MVTNPFGPWGDDGEKPPDNFTIEGGDQANEKHYNFLWDKIKETFDSVITLLEDHNTRHENGGVDEIDATGLDVDGSGNTTDSHAARHGDGGADEVDATGLDVDGSGNTTDNHSARHDIGGADEIPGLASHGSRHHDGGADEIDAADLSGASGTSGQVLETDGTSASWSTPPSLGTGDFAVENGTFDKTGNATGTETINYTSFDVVIGATVGPTRASTDTSGSISQCTATFVNIGTGSSDIDWAHDGGDTNTITFEWHVWGIRQ